MVSDPGTLHPVPPSVEPPSAPPATLKRRLRRRYLAAVPITIATAFGGVYWYSSQAQTDSVPPVAEALTVDAIAVEPVSQYTTERAYTGDRPTGSSSA